MEQAWSIQEAHQKAVRADIYASVERNIYRTAHGGPHDLCTRITDEVLDILRNAFAVEPIEQATRQEGREELYSLPAAWRASADKWDDYGGRGGGAAQGFRQAAAELEIVLSASPSPPQAPEGDRPQDEINSEEAEKWLTAREGFHG